MESIQDLLKANRLERANIVLKQLFKVESLTLDVEGFVLIQEKPTLVKFESVRYTAKHKKNLRMFFIHKL